MERITPFAHPDEPPSVTRFEKTSVGGDAPPVAESTTKVGSRDEHSSVFIPVFFLTRFGFRVPLRFAGLASASVEEHPEQQFGTALPPTAWLNLPQPKFDTARAARYHFRRSLSSDLTPAQRAWHRSQARLLCVRLGRPLTDARSAMKAAHARLQRPSFRHHASLART